ncbi:hypothetical protein [Roseibium aggregatum]|uniref:Uncharacterized protein n=1 Tax=Roseibium aggregatum TaxID=187304 RepID=A0A939J223_9HYPH|nr:hypothetical protein [Roseibium aggregatum]MBN9669087.1 hypothetical protein [Roseibium aggregatum]
MVNSQIRHPTRFPPPGSIYDDTIVLHTSDSVDADNLRWVENDDDWTLRVLHMETRRHANEVLGSPGPRFEV